MKPISEWYPYAYCKGMPTNTYFPEKGKSANEARKDCAKCPVQQDCLDYAIVHNEQGIWGGKSQKQRQNLPAFIRDFIRSEYEKRGWVEDRTGVDVSILLLRRKQREEQRQEVQSLEPSIVDLPSL